MIKYLKSSDPIAWLLSPILAVVFLTSIFLDSKSSNLLSIDLIDLTITWELTDIWYYLLLVLLLSTTSTLYNLFFNRAEFVKSNHLIAGFFYMIFSLIVVSFLGFHSILISCLFLFLALKYLLSIHKQKRALHEYFMAGFCLGLASLFFPPWIALLPFFLFSITIHGVVSWRRIIVLILGSSLIYVYFFVTHFIFDLPIEITFMRNIDYFDLSTLPLSITIFFSLSIVLLLLALKQFGNSFIGSTIQSRSAKKLLMVISVGIVISMILGVQYYGFNFLYIIPIIVPSFISFSLMKQKSSRFTIIAFYLAILSFVYHFAHEFISALIA